MRRYTARHGEQFQVDPLRHGHQPEQPLRTPEKAHEPPHRADVETGRCGEDGEIQEEWPSYRTSAAEAITPRQREWR
ncbi:hypothetical protein FGB62_9g08 [Gracilaria domingensis]|nr:hypothetical protein FGB62_9g08 [Gracilaria domingensis]